MTKYIVFFFLCILSLSSDAAITCEVVSDKCIDKGATIQTPSGAVVDPNGCKKHVKITECSSSEVTSSCTDEDVTGCELALTEEIDYNLDGSVAAWEQSWVCDTIANEQCNPDTASKSQLEKDGFCSIVDEECTDDINGVCVTKEYTYSCQEPSESCLSPTEEEICDLIDSECVGFTDNDGYGCLTERQTYKCTSESEYCTSTSTTNSCNPDMTKGLEESTQVDHSSELADIAAGMQVAKAIENDIDGDPPKVFGGKSLHCTRDLMGGIGLGKNCCSTGTITGDGSLFDQCTGSEEQLAMARKAGRAKHVVGGPYIKQYIDLAVGGFCGITEKRRQYFCSFDSMLSRIIQEQGRNQLEALTANSESDYKESMSFDYISDGGQVLNKINVGSFQVGVYSLPAACENKTSGEDSRCKDSLHFDLHVAETNSNFRTEMEVPIFSEDPIVILKNMTIEPDQFQGFCDKDPESPTYTHCSLTVKTWGNEAGKSYSSAIISASRFSNRSGWSESIIAGDDWTFQVWQEEFSGAAVSDSEPLKIRWSIDGTTWNQLDLPSEIDVSEDFKINNEAVIYGSCKYNQCDYNVKIPLPVAAKPWIAQAWTKQHGCEKRYILDCGGFTINEFQTLDIGLMDLGEFKQSIQDTVKDDLPDASDYESMGVEAAERGAANANAGNITPMEPGVVNGGINESAAWLDTERVLIDQNLSAFATVRWPDNYGNDSVSDATVKWGDGSSSSMARASDRFKASHKYTSSGEYKVLVTQVMADGSEHSKQLRIVVEELDRPIPGLGGSPF